MHDHVICICASFYIPSEAIYTFYFCEYSSGKCSVNPPQGCLQCTLREAVLPKRQLPWKYLAK